MYTWSFDQDGYWGNEQFDSVEECIEDAKDNLELEYDSENIKYVYVGEYVPYIPHIDCEYLMYDIFDDAYLECGEAADDWNPYDYKEIEENEELDKAVTEVILNWLKKYDRMPRFGTVKNIKEITL